VGEALTIAHSSHDPELLLSLFADDARLQFFTGDFTPDEIRSGAAMSGSAGNFQYDRGWATVMNERYTYSSCQVNGDRVLCDLEVTSDWLAPLAPPTPHTVAVQVRDGKIIDLVLAAVAGPDDDLRADFHRWTFENHPDQASLMWVADWSPVEILTEESARLHLRLGEEYVATLGQGEAG
jgi:hypothetical protein